MKTELDLIDYLNVEFKLRKERNNNYSLRAFAKNIGVQPATLSHVLKRKRQPSESFKKKVYKSLDIPIEQSQNFDNVQKGFNNSNLDMDLFVTMSEWYFDAILELLRVSGFESNVDYVAQKLDLPKGQVRDAVKRLFDLNLIKESPNKTWVETEGNSEILGGESTSVALQKLQIQLLKKAIEAVQNTPKPQREQMSMTMAINEKDLPEVRKRIREFQNELCEYLQRPQRDLNKVYQLTTSFFPLSN